MSEELAGMVRAGRGCGRILIRARGERDPVRGDDWVRIELETALARGIPVVPVLVGGARVPAPSTLPESLNEFSRRQAFQRARALDSPRDESIEEAIEFGTTELDHAPDWALINRGRRLSVRPVADAVLR